MDTVETLRQMIAEEFELDPETIQPDTDLMTMGIDSLSVIEFLFKVEDKFKVILPDRRFHESKDLKTVNAGRRLRDLAAELDELRAAQKSQSNSVGSGS